ERALQRAQRAAKGQDKDAIALVKVFEKLLPALNEGEAARTVALDDDERKLLRSYNLLTLKPTMYIANVAEDGFEDNELFEQVAKHAASEGAEIVAVCAQIESDIAELDGEEKTAFLAVLGMD